MKTAGASWLIVLGLASGLLLAAAAAAQSPKPNARPILSSWPGSPAGRIGSSG